MKVSLAIPAGISIAFFFSGCSGSCDNQMLSSVTSPSGQLKAVVFSRTCGATTRFNTQVSIIKTEASLPDEGGNALVIGRQIPLTVVWSAESRITVSGLGAATVFKTAPSASGVEIAYQ
jgi:hypothetical protein